MPEINPLTNEQIFLKKIAENTGSDYETGDVSEINPLTIDQILLKEIAANTAGQSGDIAQLEEDVQSNASAIEAIENVTGAKNVLPFDLHTIKSQNDGGTWSGNSYTYNGITFQFQLNSKGQLVGIDVSGTASAFVGVQLIDIASKNVFLESGEKYILSGIPTGLSGIRMTFATNYGGIWTTQATDEGLGDDFVAPTSIYSYDGCTIQIDSGTAISGTITIKPMIRPAGTDPTYVPYAMTNKELTEKVMSMMPPVTDLSANGTVMFVNASGKWGIFLPLPFIVNSSWTFSFSNIQIVYVTTLTYHSYTVRNNGVIVLVDEDLSAFVNREGYAQMTITNKNMISYEVISETSEDKKEEKKATKKKEEKKATKKKEEKK